MIYICKNNYANLMNCDNMNIKIYKLVCNMAVEVKSDDVKMFAQMFHE